MRKNHLIFIVFLVLFPFVSQAGTVLSDDGAKKVPTGLMSLPDYRYPVYLYVPEGYTAEKEYPLIVSIPDEGETPDKHMDYWINVAARRTAIILSATNLWPDDMPNRMDEWLLKIKKDVTDRYRINPSQMFLVGLKGGAHYAAYLAMAYPSEFTAAALLGEAWTGKFEQLMHPSSTPSQQIPFYVVFEKNALPDTVEAAKRMAMKLENKGYLISLAQLEGSESFSDMEFKLNMLNWLTEKSGEWEQRTAESNKSWKEKVRHWFWRNVNT